MYDSILLGQAMVPSNMLPCISPCNSPPFAIFIGKPGDGRYVLRQHYSLLQYETVPNVLLHDIRSVYTWRYNAWLLCTYGHIYWKIYAIFWGKVSNSYL